MSKRRLWLEAGESKPLTKLHGENYGHTFERFSSRPSPVPLRQLVQKSLVVGQEFVLACFFLACHRSASLEDEETNDNRVAERLQPSLGILWLAFLLVILHNRPDKTSQSPPADKNKVRHRATDGLFMAVLLRFLAAVLRTLTASYSSDTVHALAIAGMALHLLACDYSYANGIQEPMVGLVDAEKRPAFQGGTLSLTAAFFATTLLASRLENNVTVYIFISSSVVLFALYPAARHQVSINTKERKEWIPLLISVLFAMATFVLLEPSEVVAVAASLVVLCILVPTWNFYLQSWKVTLKGPWDIAHV